MAKATQPKLRAVLVSTSPEEGERAVDDRKQAYEAMRTHQIAGQKRLNRLARLARFRSVSEDYVACVDAAYKLGDPL
jgi:hypothetical protein